MLKDVKILLKIIDDIFDLNDVAREACSKNFFGKLCKLRLRIFLQLRSLIWAERKFEAKTSNKEIKQQLE